MVADAQKTGSVPICDAFSSGVLTLLSACAIGLSGVRLRCPSFLGGATGLCAAHPAYLFSIDVSGTSVPVAFYMPKTSIHAAIAAMPAFSMMVTVDIGNWKTVPRQAHWMVCFDRTD